MYTTQQFLELFLYWYSSRIWMHTNKCTSLMLVWSWTIVINIRVPMITNLITFNFQYEEMYNSAFLNCLKIQKKKLTWLAQRKQFDSCVHTLHFKLAIVLLLSLYWINIRHSNTYIEFVITINKVLIQFSSKYVQILQYILYTF